MLANNNLQIHQVTKADEGVYRCEASVEARGEIDFVDIAVVVNGELHFVSLLGRFAATQCNARKEDCNYSEVRFHEEVLKTGVKISKLLVHNVL